MDINTTFKDLVEKKLGTHKDQIPGGYADKKKPSDVSQKELKMGTEDERKEHAKNNPKLAREIAMDHLIGDDPKYYTKLKRAGL